MASGIINLTQSNSSGNYIDGKIEWSSAKNVAGNYSLVDADIYVKKGSTTTTLTTSTSGTWGYTLTVGSKSISGSVSKSVLTSWVKVASLTDVKVSHDADGSKSVTISGSVTAPSGTSYAGKKTSGSKSVELDTIARVSVPTVSASSIQMGKTLTITTNRKSTDFTHTLQYTFGGTTKTIKTGVGASYTWEVPDLASLCNNVKSATCTITCITYNGSTKIGTKAVKVTLTVPSASTITCPSSATMKGTASFTLKRNSSAFTHTLKYTFGTKTATIKTGLKANSYEWEIPDLALYCEASGTCKITCYTYNGSALVGSTSDTFTLKVPAKSTISLSASSVTMGKSLTITISRNSSNFTHYVAYEFGDRIGTISQSATTKATWTTVPLDLAKEIKSSTSGKGKIICYTYNGSAQIGFVEKEFTAVVPENDTTKPDMTMKLSCVNPLSSAFNGIYVQGKSKMKADYDASSEYSTIKSYKTTVQSKSYSGDPVTSNILSQAGKYTVTGVVTDARGFTRKDDTKSIEVIAYGSPSIEPKSGTSFIICDRCRDNGDLYDGGMNLRITARRNYSKVVSNGEQKNFCVFGYRIKSDSDETYGADQILLGRNDSADEVDILIPSVVESLITKYTVQLFVEDDIEGRITKTFKIGAAGCTLHKGPGGYRLGLKRYVKVNDDGTPLEEDGIDVGASMFFDDGMYIKGGMISNLKGYRLLDATADAPIELDDLKTPGCYFSPSSTVSANISHAPTTTSGFRLEVRQIQNSNWIQQRATYRQTERVRCWGNTAWSDWFTVITTENVADYPTERGTSGGWRYRKWKNGDVEAWYTVSFSIAAASVTKQEIAIPSGLFPSKPRGNVSIRSSSTNSNLGACTAMYNYPDSSTTKFIVQVANQHGSDKYSLGIDIYAYYLA